MGCCGDSLLVRQARAVAKLSPRQVAEGAFKVASTVVVAHWADEGEIDRRRDVCRKCVHATRSRDKRFSGNAGLTSLSWCALCACNIKLKTLRKEEVCPEHRW